MMPGKATRPLNRGAVQAANRELYRRHPELVTDGRGRQLSAQSSEDAALRAEWMDLYVKSGGTAKPVSASTAAETKAAVAENFSTGRAGSGAQMCTFEHPLKQIVSFLPVPPRKLPAQGANQQPCELNRSDITCKHDRSAGPERVLMVVAQGSDSDDTISAKLAMTGGCGVHPDWTYGPVPSGSGKSTSIQFSATAKASILATAPNDWKAISPVSTRISASACGGTSGDCDIRAYPSGKATLEGELGVACKFYPSGEEDMWEGNVAISYGYDRENVSAEKFTVDFLKFIQKFSKAISDKLSGSADEPPKAPKSEGKIETKLAASGEWEWKEETGSWKAYCESTIKYGASPLVEVSGEFPICGPPIPPKLKKWVDLGLYAGAAGRVTLNAERTSKYFPHDGTEVAGTWEAKGEGELEFSLFAKLLLVSEDFVSGSVGGKTSLTTSAAKAASGAPQIEFKREWSGLKATLSVEAVWGWLSYEREFVLCEKYKFKTPWIWDFK